MSERGTESGGRDNETEYDVKGPAPKGTRTFVTHRIAYT